MRCRLCNNIFTPYLRKIRRVVIFEEFCSYCCEDNQYGYNAPKDYEHNCYEDPLEIVTNNGKILIEEQ